MLRQAHEGGAGADGAGAARPHPHELHALGRVQVDHHHFSTRERDIPCARYGDPEAAERTYLVNLRQLCSHLRQILKPSAVFCWLGTLPLASEIKAGFLVPEIRFLGATLRFPLDRVGGDTAIQYHQL